MASPQAEAARKARRLNVGNVEESPSGWRIWRSGEGYVSKAGGFTKHPSKALAVSGPGEAIRIAALHGFAITSW